MPANSRTGDRDRISGNSAPLFPAKKRCRRIPADITAAKTSKTLCGFMHILNHSPKSLHFLGSLLTLSMQRVSMLKRYSEKAFRGV